MSPTVKTLSVITEQLAAAGPKQCSHFLKISRRLLWTFSSDYIPSIRAGFKICSESSVVLLSAARMSRIEEEIIHAG